MSGNATLTVSTPFDIQRGDEGIHEVRIALSCQASEESDLTIMARQLASLENRVRQIEEGFENEIIVEDLIHCSLEIVTGGIVSTASTSRILPEESVITDPVRLELDSLFSISESAEGEI